MRCASASQPPGQQSWCRQNVPKEGLVPQLIVPVDVSKPNIHYGPSKNGTAGGKISSIFNFDIPASAANKTCAINFFFPNETQIDPSAFVFSGEEHKFKFTQLEGAAMANTTYGSAPRSKLKLAEKELPVGDDKMIEAIDCPAGESIGIWWEAMYDSYLSFVQESAPCPMGLYIDID
ncbi:hypothetical protein HII31_01619 [Pseudocercospora fuligena]|uniref:Ubiquitin 3 binding protein But2 C-terminal domain-containing protein n=1 Tax=Pseudocercospora fuligena TaxID=685502 RepID=A0A8H6RTZ5_9PEZI|nr:hypothetical protein HII31_01619 [Pseudocercospora fuligena]